MKILFFSGSPRKNGNIATIVNQIDNRLNDNYDTEVCYISDFIINGCQGCSHICQQNLTEPGCNQEDQVNILLDKIINADIIVYGSPLYGHSFPGQLKMFLDRHVALFKFIGGSDKSVDEMEIFSFIKGKPIVFIVSCQGPEENNTEIIQMQIDKFFESSLAKCIGKYIFPLCSPDVSVDTFSSDKIDLIVNDIKSHEIS